LELRWHGGAGAESGSTNIQFAESAGLIWLGGRREAIGVRNAERILGGKVQSLQAIESPGYL